MTPEELAVRVLRKIKVLGANETASAEDIRDALQAVKDAHAALQVQDLVRWTLADIPAEAEVGYVLMASYLAADDFVVPKDEAWMGQGLRHIQALVHIPATDNGCYIADF